MTTGVEDTTCCYATKTETWVTDPDGARWEWYVKTGDAEQMSASTRRAESGAACCAPGSTGDTDTSGDTAFASVGSDSDDGGGCC